MIAVAGRAGQVAAAWVLACVLGQAAAQQVPEPVPRVFADGVLWKLERAGAPPSWLLGTLHLGDERVNTLPPAVQRALARSRALALEMVASDADAERFERASFFPGPEAQVEMLGAELAQRLREALAVRGYPPRLAARMKPWAAMLALVAPPPPQGEILDQVIAREARRRGLPVHPLETLDGQLAAFEGLPAGVQRELTANLLDNLAAADGIREALVAAWRSGDLAQMWRLDTGFLRRGGGFSEANRVFVERVIFARNEAMVQRLLPLLERGGVFVAVGALHLTGERGLLARLQERGWRPLRVPPGR